MSLATPLSLNPTVTLPWWAARAGLLDLIEIATARLNATRNPAVALAMAEALVAVDADEVAVLASSDRLAAELARARAAFAAWPAAKRRRALRKVLELMPVAPWGEAARGLRGMDVVPAVVRLWSDGTWSAPDVADRAAQGGEDVDPQNRPAILFPVFASGLGADVGAQRLVDLVAVTLDAKPVAASFATKRTVIGPYGGDELGVVDGCAAITADALAWARARLAHGLNAMRSVEMREPVERVDLIRDGTLLAAVLRDTYGQARTIETPLDPNDWPLSFPMMVRKALGARAGRVVVLAPSGDDFCDEKAA